MRQKIWEHKHRLGSFRRRAKLPGPRDPDPLMSLSPGQLDDPRLLALSSFRRGSDAGSFSPGGGQQPERRGSQSRSPKGRRSLSPIHYPSEVGDGRYSPSRRELDDSNIRSLSPVRFDESRSRTPLASRQGSEAETIGMSPTHSRREYLSREPGSLLSPSWMESRSASPRASAFFPDSDMQHLAREHSPYGDRRTSISYSERRASIAPTDLLTEQLEGPAFPPDDDYLSRDRETDDDSWHYESRL